LLKKAQSQTPTQPQAAQTSNNNVNVNVNVNENTSTNNGNTKMQPQLQDLQDLVSDFISEVDGWSDLDGDDDAGVMERKDVLWMMSELNLRVQDIVKVISTSAAAAAAE